MKVDGGLRECAVPMHLSSTRSPFPHQTLVLDWAAERRHAALFLEMRLGKTFTVIRHLQQTEAARCLVVAPVSVLPGWMNELKMEGEVGASVRGTPDQRREIASVPSRRRRWWLISYESLRHSPEIAAMEWDAVILDESTRIKNPRAKITKLLLRNAAGIPHRFILSGLPAPESVMDYWTQMAFVHGGRWMGCRSFYDWRTRFFAPDERGYEWAPNSGTTDRVISTLNDSAYVCSRQDAGLGERRLYQKLYVEPTDAQAKAYARARDSFRARVHGEDVLTTSALVQWNWMLRLSGGFSADGQFLVGPRKVDELVRLLTETDLKSQPVVVWCHFLAEMECVHQRLRSHGVTTAVIDGSTPAWARDEVVKSFGRQNRVLIIQEEVGRFGLNLAVADAAVYYSRGYSHETRAQSEDRIVHPTKKRPLLFVDLITSGTLDSDVLDAVKMKKLSSAQVMRRVMKQVRRRDR